MRLPVIDGRPILVATPTNERSDYILCVDPAGQTMYVTWAQYYVAVMDAQSADDYVLKNIYDRIGELTDAVNVLTLAVERLSKEVEENAEEN